jgi:glutathione S-transferase
MKVLLSPRLKAINNATKLLSSHRLFDLSNLTPDEWKNRHVPQWPAQWGVRASGIALLRAALAPIAVHLQTRTWLVGERFTIADAYLGVFLGWIARAPGQPFKEDTLDAYFLRYQQRPSVIAALEAEAVLLHTDTGANNKTSK